MLLDNNSKYLTYRQNQGTNNNDSENQSRKGSNLVAPIMDAGLDIYMGVSRALKSGVGEAVSHLSKYDNYISFSYMDYNSIR